MVLPLEEHVDLAERWSLRVLGVPALPHQIDDFLRAAMGRWQAELVAVPPVVVRAVLNHLLVGQSIEGLPSGEGHDLPQGHAE